MGAVIGYLILSPIVTRFYENKAVDKDPKTYEKIDDQEDPGQR
jgi:hypothetical protein